MLLTAGIGLVGLSVLLAFTAAVLSNGRLARTAMVYFPAGLFCLAARAFLYWLKSRRKRLFYARRKEYSSVKTQA